jgi:LysR family glycine cleavage system transcriptional activator
LTDAGRRLVDGAAPSLARVAAALDEVSAQPGETVGRVRVSVPRAAVPFVIDPVLPTFRARHPRVDVEIVIDERLVDIVAEGYDAGVRLSESIERDMVQVRVTDPFRFVIVGSPRYFERYGTPERPEDLLRVDRLAPNDPWWAGWLAAAGVDTVPPRQHRGIELDSQLQEASAVQGGYGIALMTPLLWRAELDAGRLVQPFATLYQPGTAHFLVHRENRVGVRKIERFREWLHAELDKDRHLLPDALWEPLP